jgi:hypothetical protein
LVAKSNTKIAALKSVELANSKCISPTEEANRQHTPSLPVIQGWRCAEKAKASWCSSKINIYLVFCDLLTNLHLVVSRDTIFLWNRIRWQLRAHPSLTIIIRIHIHQILLPCVELRLGLGLWPLVPPRGSFSPHLLAFELPDVLEFLLFVLL